MNWIDIAIVLVFGLYIYEGYRRGFIEQILELVGFFITLLITYWTYKPIAFIFADYAQFASKAAQPITFLLLWVIYQVFYSLLLQRIYPLIPHQVRSNLPNKITGVLPAFFKAFIFTSVILTLTVLMTVPAKLKQDIESSFFGSRFVSESGKVEQYMSRVLGGDLKETLTFLTVPAQTEEIIQPNERVQLSFTYHDGVVDREAEQKMLSLVNEERVKVGFKPLKWDEQLAEVARKHSRDMFERGYFSHENLDGKSPFDRMKDGGVTFRTAGENIAYAATVDLAHGGLMRSPGHRANILESDFGTVGIGVIDGGIYGKMFTQNFKD